MVVLLLIVAGLIAWRSRGVGVHDRRGWPWFAAWSIAGALAAFSGMSAVGLFVVPFAAGALIWVARRAPGGEAIGFLEGIGAMLLLIAYVNRDYTPCRPGGLTIPPGAPPGTSVSCGGLDPHPWLLAGTLASGCALLGYAALRLRVAKNYDASAAASSRGRRRETICETPSSPIVTP